MEILYVYERSPYLDLTQDARVFPVSLLRTIPGDAIQSIMNRLYINETMVIGTRKEQFRYFNTYYPS